MRDPSQANLAFIAAKNLYLHDHIPLTGHGDRTESLPIIYLFPLHTTVVERIGTNQISPMTRSLTGESRYHNGLRDREQERFSADSPFPSAFSIILPI